MEQDIITLQDIFLFEKTGITEAGKVTGRFRATGIRPKFYDRLKAVRHHAADADVPDGGGDQLNAAGVIVAFIVVFALIMVAVSVGLKFFDARRKRQVADMLQTAAGEPVVTVAQPAQGNRAGQADAASRRSSARCTFPSMPRR